MSSWHSSSRVWSWGWHADFRVGKVKRTSFFCSSSFPIKFLFLFAFLFFTLTPGQRTTINRGNYCMLVTLCLRAFASESSITARIVTRLAFWSQQDPVRGSPRKAMPIPITRADTFKTLPIITISSITFQRASQTRHLSKKNGSANCRRYRRW